MENGKDSKCPACGGDEWILKTDERGRDIAIECECRKKGLLSRRMRFADIPEAFASMNLKTFKTDVYRKAESKPVIITACKTVREYINNFAQYQSRGIGLYIYSSTKGSGKTRIAASIANELMQTLKKQVKFAVSTTILNEIKKSWDKNSEYTESRLLNHLTTTEILIIDDFGTEKVTDWVGDKFYHIINERYINKKVTIFTSNESLKTLKYDDRIVNRIKEMTYQIQFPEESVRDYIAESHNQEMLKKIGAAK